MAQLLMVKDAPLWAFQSVPTDIRTALKGWGRRTFRRRGMLLRALDVVVAAHRNVVRTDGWAAPEILNWLIAHKMVRRDSSPIIMRVR